MTEMIAFLLRWVFTYIFYPVIVICMFLSVWGHIIYIISEGNDLGRFRRSVGALLPLVFLIFSLTTYSDSNILLSQYLQSIPIYLHVLAGAILGVGIIELGRIASKTDSDAGAAIYALFSSSIGTFLLYCFMKDALSSLNNFLLTALMSGGLYVIFRKF